MIPTCKTLIFFRKLVSAFDVYKTMRDVLEKFTRARQISANKKNVTLQDLGTSFFAPIAHRSCKQTGIPDDFCPCHFPESYSNETILTKLALAAVDRINNLIPSECYKLSVDALVAGARFDDGRILVTFETNPGNFKFEALGRFENLDAGSKLTVISFFRISKIKSDPFCLLPEHKTLQVFCYCPFQTPLARILDLLNSIIE